MNVRFIGGVIAVALIAGGYILADRFYGVPEARPDNSPEAVDEELQSQGVHLFKVLKKTFPDEYGTLTVRLSQALEQNASQQEIAELTRRSVAEIRQDAARYIASAPAEDLARVVEQSRDLHLKVREDLGQAQCNQFAVAGPGGLGEDISRYVDEIDLQGGLVMQAAAKGRDTPRDPPAGQATNEDWQTARASAAATGTPQGDLDGLRTLDLQNADLCRGLAGLLEAILADQGESGARLRASYVADLARN